MTTIEIQPYVFGAANNQKTATKFEVRYVTYFGNGAVADCHLLNSAGTEVMSVGLVTATAAQCESWENDDLFAASLARNAGFDPTTT